MKCIKRAAAERVFRGGHAPCIHQSVRQNPFSFSHFVWSSLSHLFGLVPYAHAARGAVLMITTPVAPLSLSFSLAPSCAQPAPLLFTAPACKSTLPSACACIFKTCSVHNMILWHGRRKWSSAQPLFKFYRQEENSWLNYQAHDHSQGGSALSSGSCFFTFINKINF
jgi:hypothetical protein